MTWHDTPASATATNERGEILAVIVREARGGEKCRVYVRDGDRAPLPCVGSFASVAAAKARVLAGLDFSGALSAAPGESLIAIHPH